MSRQQALNEIWKRLLLVLCLSMGICAIFFFYGDTGRVGVLVFVIGNIGGYVSVNRGLANLNDADVVELAASLAAAFSPRSNYCRALDLASIHWLTRTLPV